MLFIIIKLSFCRSFIIFVVIMKKYKQYQRKRTELIKKYKLSNEDIRGFFGFINVDSFNNSKGKARYIQGVESLLQYLEEFSEKK